ncbi:MAG: Bifunctional riboflavin kinase/FMN adenylyltransferase [Chlamydiae bacterium]|nr:Bifunctional riboflavin kinase/FMN adenylyltransferase [Chlamydiota bacterium]
MKIIHEIHDQFTKCDPVVLTIGFFDGVHLGHQKIFSKLRELKGSKGKSITLTFKSHPYSQIRPETVTPLISTLNHRIELIKNQGVDTLILLEFDQKLHKTSADDFLMSLHEKIPFDHLVLGPDATIGYKKEGNADMIQLLSKKYSFSFHPQTFCRLNHQEVSSTRIRESLKAGKLMEVSQMLDRPYSILAKVVPGRQIGMQIGFPTLNLNVDTLALPPLGVYQVRVLNNGELHQGIANLGFAPTIDGRKTPQLEVHLLDYEEKETPGEIEVIFEQFIRSEMKFHSLDELKTQIQKDIDSVFVD